MTDSGESVTPPDATDAVGNGAASGGRARWWVAGSFVALVAAGVLSGIALDRMVLAPHSGGRMGGGGSRGPGGGMPPFGDMRGGRGGAYGRGGPPDSVRRRMRDRFAEEFGLSPVQRVQIDSLMSRQEPKFRALREKFAPAMDSITTETQSEMDKILTPEPREKMKAARERTRERRPGDPRRP